MYTKIYRRNVHMYYIVGFLLAVASIKICRQYRRMPGRALLVYVMVLTMDLVVGGSIIYWKCSVRESEEECELAIGGTLGSVVIWLMLLLLCPCFATRCEICIALDKAKQKCNKYMQKLRPRQTCDSSANDAVHKQATSPLLVKGQGHNLSNGDIVRYREDTLDLRLMKGQNNSISQFYVDDEKSETRDNSNKKFQKFDDP